MQLYSFEVLKGEEIIAAEASVPLVDTEPHGQKLQGWRRKLPCPAAASGCASNPARRSF